MDEDKATTVGITLRLREDLRRDLEESARARRVSLNQECIDRLTYVQDRKSLLAEVMRLTFGDRLAGLLLAIGFAMAGAAANSRSLFRQQSSSDWIEDPTTFNEAAHAANRVLVTARPEGEVLGTLGRGQLGRLSARHVMAAVGGRPIPTENGSTRLTRLMAALPARELDAIKDLLGPVTKHVRNVMASRIASGEWKPNAPIPSESYLAREIGVSAETMRKALEIMEREGLLVRRPGKVAAEESEKSKAKRD
jgi:regulatory GntR family protein